MKRGKEKRTPEIKKGWEAPDGKPDLDVQPIESDSRDESKFSEETNELLERLREHRRNKLS